MGCWSRCNATLRDTKRKTKRNIYLRDSGVWDISLKQFVKLRFGGTDGCRLVSLLSDAEQGAEFMNDVILTEVVNASIKSCTVYDFTHSKGPAYFFFKEGTV